MDEQIPFAALTEVDGVPIITIGATPHLLFDESEPSTQRAVEKGISEMRSWTREQRSRTDRWVGLCLPDQHGNIVYERKGNIARQQHSFESFFRCLLCIEAQIFPEDFLAFGLLGANQVAPRPVEPVFRRATREVFRQHRESDLR